MKTRRNKREHNEQYTEGRHLKLNDLKKEARGFVMKYLKKNIPNYPRPEFHVTHLKHDTNRKGLTGIRRDGGFRDPGKDSLQLLWWSLVVGPDDVTAAETRLLEKTFPDRTEEQVQMQQSFLGKFATSPAFKETSRLGSYRFTFPLEEVLQAYSQQFCFGAQPVMRVFKTVLYKQEVVHVVVVHSLANQQLFSEYPLLTDDPNAVCVYRDGCFIWRPEAMCETHWYELIERRDEKQMEVKKMVGWGVQYYVWDNVAVGLHMEKGQVLGFGADRLRESLGFCEEGKPKITRERFDKYEQAENCVKELWPQYPASLRKELSLQESLADAIKNRYQPSLQEPRSALDPQTLIVGDISIKDVQGKNLRNSQKYCRPRAVVSDMIQLIPDLLAQHPTVENIVVHVGANDIWKKESEVLKKDFIDLLNFLSSLDVEAFISGPLPLITRRVERFSRLYDLNTWLPQACARHPVRFIDNFDLFWRRRHLFRADGIRLNKRGVKLFISNLFYCIRRSSVSHVQV
ncbi:hypothetical protein EXN66_Car021175 [Channa argus]|uniref:Uncharacterized protein n=1 Tax=Channa argus TaxID=215402 RepID=A0A6G1QSL3_CHAAH|nr:hypothetical protein EXN66_Car021175 [Channa argus]